MKISDLTPIVEADDPALAKLKAAIAKMKELKPELARGSSATPATASGTRTTTSRTSVSGTIRMGRPEGPIEFNGRTVNPGDPDYGAASDALMAQQQRMQQARASRYNRSGSNRGGNAPRQPAAVQQGASQTRDIDF